MADFNSCESLQVMTPETVSRQYLKLVLVGCVLEHHFIALARSQDACHCRAMEGRGWAARSSFVECLPSKAVCHACRVQHPEALHVVHLNTRRHLHTLEQSPSIKPDKTQSLAAVLRNMYMHTRGA